MSKITEKDYDRTTIVKLKKVEYDYWVSKGLVINPVHMNSDVEVVITLRMVINWKEDQIKTIADVAIKENFEKLIRWLCDMRFDKDPIEDG